MREVVEPLGQDRPASEKPAGPLPAVPAGRDHARHLAGLIQQVAEATEALHRAGVLHRDIKPDNILLVGGHVRLSDFSLPFRGDQELVSASVWGAPAYMAPEVWRGNAGPSSDQYSLACTYAELRLGRRDGQ